VELSSRSLRQRGYHHRIPGAAPSHALSGAPPLPIVVIRECGLTIIELELEQWSSATGGGMCRAQPISVQMLSNRGT